MEDFDWVTATCQCSTANIFETLKAQVKSDVEKRKSSAPEAQARGSFSVVTNGGSFAVTVQDFRTPHRAVVFELVAEGIRVHDDQKLSFIATATISNERICKLKVDDQEYEFWQVRKMALENLFFGKSS